MTVINAFDKNLQSTIKDLMEKDALSVLIVRFPCRVLDKTKMPQPVFNKEKCIRCGACLQIDCPAIYKADDGSIVLDEFLCAGCNVCVSACKFEGLKERE